MAWYKNVKKAQFEADPQTGEQQRMARYRGIMVYEVRVPQNLENPEAEQAAAQTAADDLYQRVFRTVGDEVFSMDPPEKLR